jgi:hypothetical protein
MVSNTGGQAFPMGIHAFEGMTLRDYFAGQALIGLAAAMNSADRRRHRDGLADGREASVAYGIADAMLKERAK